MAIGLVIALGVLQGLTEFLPVSSSGHLRVLSELFEVQDPKTLFDILLHVGSLVAVLVVYRRLFIGIVVGFWRLVSRRGTWSEEADARLGVFAIVGTVPTALIAVLLGDWMEGLAADIRFVGAMLIVNGCVLLGLGVLGRRALRNANPGRDLSEMRISDALIIGSTQGLGIFRGISRSGTTITAGLMTGLSQEAAAAFSFVLSVPAILGALVLKFDSAAIAADGAGSYILGAVVAAVVGILALTLLLRLLRKGQLHHFAWYCFALGALVLVYPALSA